MEVSVYTDSSVVRFGCGHFFRLGDVPKRKLLRRYRSDKKKHQKNKKVDLMFIAYVESNLDRFYQEARSLGNHSLAESINSLGVNLDTEIKPRQSSRRDLLDDICEKIIYLSKKDAQAILVKARSTKQKHKKPIRSYECNKCGFWHVTSLPIDKWKKNKSKKK